MCQSIQRVKSAALTISQTHLESATLQNERFFFLVRSHIILPLSLLEISYNIEQQPTAKRNHKTKTRKLLQNIPKRRSRTLEKSKTMSSSTYSSSKLAFTNHEYHAIKCNNDGVLYLQHGMYDQAVASFSESLFLSKQLINAMRRTVVGDDQNIEDCMQSSHQQQQYQHRPHCQFATAPSQPQQKQQPFQNKKSFIVTTPVEIHEGYSTLCGVSSCEDNQLSSAPMQCYIRMSFIVMFNLAITYHLGALNVSQTMSLCNDEPLSKAKKLYELAYCISTQENVEICAYYTISIVNNLSQIHAMVGNDVGSKLCCENLLQSLVYLKETGVALDKAIGVEHMEGLYSNVMHLVLTNQQVAPAA